MGLQICEQAYLLPRVEIAYKRVCTRRLTRQMFRPISSESELAVIFRATMLGWEDRIRFRGLRTSPASVPTQPDIPITITAATTTTIGDRGDRGIQASVGVDRVAH